MIKLELFITCTNCNTTKSYPFTKGDEWYQVHDDPSVLENVNKEDFFKGKQFNSETTEIACTTCDSMIEFSL